MALVVATLLIGCGDDASLGRGELQVQPSNLTFSPSLGQAEEQAVTLANVGEEPLVVTDVAVRGDVERLATVGLTLPLTLAPGASTTFTVAYEASECAARTGFIRFRTTHALTAATDVPFDTPQLVGRLLLSPESIDFGEVSLGTTAARTVSLTNAGSCSVVISDLFLTGSGEFRLSDEDASEDRSEQLSLRLLPGEVLDFAVLFEPGHTGCDHDEAVLVVRTDDAATRPPDSLSVEGCGAFGGR